ncbi:uncharacterized protein LOC131211652 [Anopheles bellator]|uniref:uncharacterized protein LOC131211652 n=1 Tax=Anopheles bellator TaxID=139047 RepID=UPI00264959DB|nr:uncharacterized protein LOC131211652 [Anopheles bellator]
MHSKTVHFFLHFLYYYNSLMGMNPFVLDRANGHRLRRNRLKFCWSFAVGCATAVLVLFSFSHILTSVPFPDLMLVRHLVYVEFLIRYCTITSCFYQIFHNQSNLLRCANRFMAIVRRLLYASDSPAAATGTVAPIVVKVLCTDIFLCILFLIDNDAHVEHYLRDYRTLNICVIVMGAQISNLVLLLLLFGAHCYGAINEQLESAITRLVSFEQRASFWGKRNALRQQICCEVSDTIDELYSVHREVTEIVRHLFKILQAPILLTNLNQFVVVLSRVYFIYVSIAQDWSRNSSLHGMINPILCITFEVSQFVLLSVVATIIAKQSRQPGVIMNTFIDAPIDTRTERSIELFNLALLSHDARIQVADMYALDLVFMYSVATTATSYLIVLIQFQLNVY